VLLQRERGRKYSATQSACGLGVHHGKSAVRVGLIRHDEKLEEISSREAENLEGRGSGGGEEVERVESAKLMQGPQSSSRFC